MQALSSPGEVEGVGEPASGGVSAVEGAGTDSVGEGSAVGSTAWVGSGDGGTLSVTVGVGAVGIVGWSVDWRVAWTGVAARWVGSGKGAGFGPHEEIKRNTKNGSNTRAFGEDLLNIGFGRPLK